MGRGRTAARGLILLALCAPVASGAPPSSTVVAELSWSPAGEHARPARLLSFDATDGEEGVRSAGVPMGATTLAVAVDERPGSERIWLDHDLRWCA